jgi:hypothetical protein
MVHRTEQEEFWKGEFGGEYSDRYKGLGWVASNVAFFRKIIARMQHVDSIIQLGSNIDLNLMARHYLLLTAKYLAVEINAKAATKY